LACAWLSSISTLAASLTYVYTSPAEYRAVSRIQITPALSVAEADELKQQSYPPRKNQRTLAQERDS
jgi:hypothetical protein